LFFFFLFSFLRKKERKKKLFQALTANFPPFLRDEEKKKSHRFSLPEIFIPC